MGQSWFQRFINPLLHFGEFDTYGVENDAAIFARGRQAVVVVALSQNGERAAQMAAMNQLGQQVDAAVFH